MTISLIEAKNEDELMSIYPHLSPQDFLIRALKRTDYVKMQIFKVVENALDIGVVSYARFHNMIHGDVLYLEEIVVAKHLRGKGYGKKIVLKILETAKALGCRTVYTDDSSDIGDRSDFFSKLGGSRVSNLYEFKVAA